MNMLLFLFYLGCYILLVWASPLVKNPSGKPHFNNVGGRIINGQTAIVGQFPWQTGLYLGNETDAWFCGGGLISDQWVLTSGHCLVGAEIAYVYVGSIDFATVPEIALSQLLIVHEDYNPSTLANDIGLIKLRKRLLLDGNTTAVDLPSEPLNGGVEVTVSGWGSEGNGPSANLSTYLNYVTLTTMENSECAELYGEGTILDEMICASTEENLVKGPCLGDGGDPAVMNPDSNPVFVGVVSFVSDAGCESGYPAGFTRTAYYRDWIKANSGV